jgi:hypothetical protein
MLVWSLLSLFADAAGNRTRQRRASMTLLAAKVKAARYQKPSAGWRMASGKLLLREAPDG